MSEAEFASFLNNSLRLISEFSANNSVHYLCMDWRHCAELIAAGMQNYDEFLNLVVWVKNSGGMGSFYREQEVLPTKSDSSERPLSGAVVDLKQAVFGVAGESPPA